MKGYQGELKFRKDDFWRMMEAQSNRCALTNRLFTPSNTEVELRDPLIREGRFEKGNFYLVDRDISPVARNLSEDSIISLAIEIVRHRGKEKGVEIHEIRKQHKPRVR